MAKIISDANDDLPWPPVRSSFRLKRPVVTFFAVLAVVWIGLSAHSTRSATCAICRIDRINHGFLGLNWADEGETDCSRWYRDNVEPAHVHVWAWKGRCRRFGIPGLYGGFACSMGNPITGLSRNTQMEIYRHFKDPLNAKALFAQIGRSDGEGYRVLEILLEWAGKDYPGPGEEWWESHGEDIEGRGVK